MADESPNTIFPDGDTAPNQPDGVRTPNRPRPGRDEDVRANDEDTEPGRIRSDRPDRPSSADDMSNPRTGPIG
jgi:hypothetical protein